MTRLFAWTTGSPGLDRIRVSLPLEQLQAHGYETEYGSLFTREHGDSDTLIGCRVSLPDPSRIWTSACGMMGGPFCVFETDDDNLGIAKSNPIPYQFWSRPEVRYHYKANLQTAHRVVTSTPYLQSLLYDLSQHPDIVIARNAVPGWMCDGPLPDQSQPLVVGWAGGESHYGDWEWSMQGIRKALAFLPEATLRFVGADYRKAIRLPKARMEHTPWFPDVDAYWKHGLDGIQIGLAPLRPHTFNRSKSEIKLIEYGARGIPVVAQDYGIYSDYVVDGETGFLVSTPKEWTAAIMELAQDQDLREIMGEQARALARTRTIEVTWQEFEEAYTP